jgi:predicted nuclease with TOPRIM domain
MLNDDEPESSGRGIGGWAWYQLGRMSTEADQSMARLVQRVTRPQSVIDANALLADNQALAGYATELVERINTLLTENERLRQQYALLASDHRALRDRAREAETEIAEHKQTSLNLAGTVNGQAVEIADLTELIEQLQKK